MFKKTAWALSLMAVQLGSVAWAQDSESAEKLSSREALDNRYYVSPMFNYSLMDKSRYTDDGLGGTLAFGKQMTDRLALELFGSYTHAGNGDDGTVNLQGYGANALIFPNFLNGVYGLAGIAYGTRDAQFAGEEKRTRDGTLFNFGVGYLLGPFNWLNDGSIRLEAREQIEQANADRSENFYDTVLSVGLIYPFGKSSKVPPAEEAPVEVVAPVADSDGDGVNDDADQCPNTPAGTQVDEKGCPLPQPCAVGEDGSLPDLAQCKVGDKVVLKNVHFLFDQSTLTPDAKAVLDGVSDAMTRAADIHVEIGGHTDAKGSDEYNQKLSERRAVSVRKYIIGKGVAGDRMNAAGYGESQPVADNETDEGRELNRRVELKIIDPATPLSVPKTAKVAKQAPLAEQDAAPPSYDAPAAAAPSEPAPAAEPAPVTAEPAPAPAAEPAAVPAGDPSAVPSGDPFAGG